MLEDSILTTTKKLLNVAPENTAFDMEIEIYINSAFAVLQQVGATPPDGFAIDGTTTKWSDFLKDRKNLNMVKSYIGLRVRLIFDPPTNSSALTALQEQAKELEWRLNIQEREFNPDAYLFKPAEPAVWEIDEREAFPEEMAVGDVGYDPKTGNLWRKS